MVTVTARVPAGVVQLTSQMALLPTGILAAYLMVIVVALPLLILRKRFG